MWVSSTFIHRWQIVIFFIFKAHLLLLSHERGGAKYGFLDRVYHKTAPNEQNDLKFYMQGAFARLQLHKKSNGVVWHYFQSKNNDEWYHYFFVQLYIGFWSSWGHTASVEAKPIFLTSGTFWVLNMYTQHPYKIIIKIWPHKNHPYWIRGQ